MEGDLKRNVELLLSIRGAKDPSLEEARQLHAKAPEEIRQALEPFGYYRPRVESRLEPQEDGDWVARYRVIPGEPVRLEESDVRLSGPGAEDPGFQSLVRDFPLSEGSVVDHQRYEAGKDSLVTYAQRTGYLDGEFDAAEVRVDLERYAANLNLAFATGPQYRLGDVTFHQDFLDEDVVRGYVLWERGEVFDYSRLLNLQRSLGDSPYFRRVEVEPRRADAGEDRIVPIDVFLTAARPQKWDVGVGYGTDTGPRFRAALQLRRINRRGHRGDMSLSVSGIERTFEGRYSIPGAYPRTDILSFYTGYSLQEPDQTDSESYLVGTSFTRSRGGWRESYGLGYERTNFTIGPDEGTVNLLIPEVAWKRVEADDRLLPSEGYLAEIRLRGADESVLSDASFGQVLTRAKAVYTVVEDVRLLGRLEVGRTFTSDLRQLPPSARYFAGGDRSVRGYGYQDLAPADPQCVAAAAADGLDAGEQDCLVGGKGLITGGLEVDWLFFDRWGRWGLAAFWDFGNALESLALDDFGDLEQGAGVGLRWLSPVGLVRLDVAAAVSRPGTPVRFHFSVGPDL